MSEVLTKVVVNCETGVQEVVPLSAEEITQRETDRLAYEAQQAEQAAADQAKATAKASAFAKLAALGLSAEEAAALVN